jgi:hypothetical protein
MRVGFAISVCIVVAACLVALLFWWSPVAPENSVRDGGSAKSLISTKPQQPVNNASTAPLHRLVPSTATAPQEQIRRQDPGKPEGQEIRAFVASRIGQHAIAVREAGGPAFVSQDESWSSVESQGDNTVACAIHGQVTDDRGAVAGAVVLAGEALQEAFGHLIGDIAGETDRRGWYEVTVPCERTVTIVAMQFERGWSRPIEIAVGQSAVRQDLQLIVSGAVEGRVTRNGRPERADLRLVEASTKLQLSTTSREDGTYRFESVVPGTYELTCGLATDPSGGEVPALKHEVVEVVSGEHATRDIELEDGALVVVNLNLSNIDGISLVQIAFLAPEFPLSNAEELRVYLKTVEGRRSRQVLVGGSTLRAPIQFHNVPAGDYRLCAILLKLEKLACEPVQVKADSSVVELSLTL